MPDSPACPVCASTLLHPQRLHSADAKQATVDFRCAECAEWTHGSCSPAELARLDREQLAGRLMLVQAYERCVSDSMEALVECLEVALRRDLVGADDFAPRRAVRAD